MRNAMFGMMIAISFQVAAVDARAQVVSKVIAKTGDAIPGAPVGVVFQGAVVQGTRLSAFDRGVIDQYGEVTFYGAAVPPAQPRFSGVFRSQSTSLVQVVALSTGITSDPGELFAVSVFNEGGVGGLAVQTGNSRGLFAGEPARYAVQTGSTVMNMPGAQPWNVDSLFGTTFNTQNPYSMNQRGDVVFHEINGFRLGFAGAQDAGASIILQHGQVVDGIQIDRISNPTVTTSGDVFAFVSGSSPAFLGTTLFAGAPGNLRPVLYGSVVPGLPTGSRLVPTISSQNVPPPCVVHALDGNAATVMAASVAGLGVNTKVLFAGNANGMMAAFWGGKDIPGLPSGWQSTSSLAVRDWYPMSANTGVVGTSFPFAAPGGAINQFGVVVGRADSMRLIMKSGDVVPAYPTATVSQLTLLGVNRWEDAIVSAVLAGPDVTSGNRQALLAITRDQGVLSLLRAGELYEVAPGDFRTVQIFGTDTYNSISAINDLRQAAVTVWFTDGTEAVLRFTIPTPSVGVLVGCGVLSLARRRRMAVC